MSNTRWAPLHQVFSYHATPSAFVLRDHPDALTGLNSTRPTFSEFPLSKEFYETVQEMKVDLKHERKLQD